MAYKALRTFPTPLLLIHLISYYCPAALSASSVLACFLFLHAFRALHYALHLPGTFFPQMACSLTFFKTLFYCHFSVKPSLVTFYKCEVAYHLGHFPFPASFFCKYISLSDMRCVSLNRFIYCLSLSNRVKAPWEQGFLPFIRSVSIAPLTITDPVASVQ